MSRDILPHHHSPYPSLYTGPYGRRRRRRLSAELFLQKKKKRNCPFELGPDGRASARDTRRLVPERTLHHFYATRA